jgi:hypothetical protein
MYADRIKELRRVRAGDLIASPDNWREHPTHQQEALHKMLAGIGYADAVLARETDDGLQIIDGHLRASLDANQMVPVLVLDVDEEEARVLLLTLDPLASMASTNRDALGDLLDVVDVPDEYLENLLYELSTDPSTDPLPEQEWGGMPEFTHENLTAAIRLVVNFSSFENLENFGNLIGQKLTPKTRAIWYPQVGSESYVTRRYVDGSG